MLKQEWRGAGEASFMGCVFFQPRGSLHVHGTDYHNRRSHPGISIAPPQLKVTPHIPQVTMRLAFFMLASRL